MKNNSEKKYPIYIYINEIKIRLLYIILSFFLTFSFCYYYGESYIRILINPILKQDLSKIFICTDILDLFFIYIKISFFISIFLIFPIIIYHIWSFLLVTLYPIEKFLLNKVILLYFILLFGLISVVFNLILPISLNFFLNFEVGGLYESFNLSFEPKLAEYINLIIRLYYILFILHQFPFILIVLMYFKVLKINSIISYRNIIYFIFLLIALTFSGPDFITQGFLFLFIVFLFELSILFVYLVKEYSLI